MNKVIKKELPLYNFYFLDLNTILNNIFPLVLIKGLEDCIVNVKKVTNHLGQTYDYTDYQYFEEYEIPYFFQPNKNIWFWLISTIFFIYGIYDMYPEVSVFPKDELTLHEHEFLNGYVHGYVIFFTLIGRIFNSSLCSYAVNINFFNYFLGYVMGILSFILYGSRILGYLIYHIIYLLRKKDSGSSWG